MKTTYYWESEYSHGTFIANNDNEAIQMISDTTSITLYKESDTLDGTPFIIILDNLKLVC
jgi:hypothetical protein